MIGLAGTAVEPRRLVLWRHGQTDWNRVGRAQGQADVSLDETGVAQARRAARLLATYQPVFVWCSDLARARETGEHLTALTGQDLVLDKRLREYDVGARQGMTRAEFEAAYPQGTPVHATDAEGHIPGAESTAEVQARMVEVMHAAVGHPGPGHTGVIVGHGGALRTGVLGFFGVPPRLHTMLAGMDNCAWTVLDQRHEYGWRIVAYNARTLPVTVGLIDAPSPRGALPGAG